MSERTFCRSVGFTSDPKIQALGAEFGPAGPLCVEEALALYTDNEGDVTVRYKVLGARAFVSRTKAKAVLLAAAGHGALELVHQDDEGCVVRFPKFFEWNPADATAAARAARYRERKRHGDVTDASRKNRNGVTETSRKKKTDVERYLEKVRGRPELLSLSDLLASRILRNDPGANVSPRGGKWLNATRLLIDKDGRSVEEIREVIEWCQADDFWHANILSMPTLRRQYTKLLLRMRSNGSSGTRQASEREEQRMEWLAMEQKA